MSTNNSPSLQLASSEVLAFILLQGACGATFAVVPFVSKRALGLVLGLVGAGGNVGSAVTQVTIITRSKLCTLPPYHAIEEAVYKQMFHVLFG